MAVLQHTVTLERHSNTASPRSVGESVQNEHCESARVWYNYGQIEKVGNFCYPWKCSAHHCGCMHAEKPWLRVPRVKRVRYGSGATLEIVVWCWLLIQCPLFKPNGSISEIGHFTHPPTRGAHTAIMMLVCAAPHAQTTLRGKWGA